VDCTCVRVFRSKPRDVAPHLKEITMPQSTTYNPMSQNVPDMADKAADKAHEAVERAADKLRPTINRVTETAHQTIDRLADKAVPAAEWAEEKAYRAQDQALRFADQCGAMVRDRPITALLSAAAVGYLLGRVMR
jgi:ElaB/YqjD/DUF883 family membrane-anchored ribosome-binding protein